MRGVKFAEQGEMMRDLEVDEAKRTGVRVDADADGFTGMGVDRQSLKDNIAKTLSKQTGLSYNTVNKYIASWAESSSDHNPHSVAMQVAAAELFGLEPTPYITDAWEQLSLTKGPDLIKRDYQYRIIQWRRVVGTDWRKLKKDMATGNVPVVTHPEQEGWFAARKEELKQEALKARAKIEELYQDELAEAADPLDAPKKIVQAIYDNTQEFLKKHGIKELVLTRGMVWLEDQGDSPAPRAVMDVLHSGGDIEAANRDIAADTMEMHANPLSSWSYTPDTASSFASGHPEDFEEYAESEYLYESIDERLREKMNEDDWDDTEAPRPNARARWKKDLNEALRGPENTSPEKDMEIQQQFDVRWKRGDYDEGEDDEDDEANDGEQEDDDDADDAKFERYQKHIAEEFGSIEMWADEEDENAEGYLVRKNYPTLVRMLACARVPAERILSTSMTGVGCLNEHEITVAGGMMKQRAYLFIDDDPQGEEMGGRLDWSDAAQWDADKKVKAEGIQGNEPADPKEHAAAFLKWAEANLEDLMTERVRAVNTAKNKIFWAAEKKVKRLLAQPPKAGDYNDRIQQAVEKVRADRDARQEVAQQKAEEPFRQKGVKKILAAGWSPESVPDGWRPAAWAKKE